MWGGAAPGAASSPKSKSKVGLVVVVVLLLLGLGSAGGFLYYRSRSSAPATSAEPNPVCQSAINCCKQVMGKQADTKAVDMCDRMLTLSEATCREWGEKYRTSGKALGVACP